jgi:glycosyltransferase involved in cell wall biosynthesis
MNIGFDAKRAMMNKTGLGNYSRSVINALQQHYPENKYFLFSPKPKQNLFHHSSKNTLEIYPSGLKNSSSSIWRSFNITNDLIHSNIDVFHGLSNELPFTISKFKGKKIVTIHDLIFLRYPNWYPTIDRFFYQLKFKFACENADIIIATSIQTKKDIIQFYKINERKIEVVYQNCDDNFKSIKSNEEKKIIKKKYNLPDEFILYVGTISERKNLLQLIKAVELLPQNQPIKLVVVGNGKEYFQVIKNYISEKKINNITFITNADFNDFPYIYQQAKCFVYPSLFEGFGIPILEALYSKIPVITSINSCFNEVGGADSIYVNPMNEFEIRDAIVEVLTSKKTIEKTQKSYEFAQRFNNQQLADDCLTIYKS